MARRPCAQRDNGSDAVSLLKYFLRQCLRSPDGSMYMLPITRNCVNELGPARGDWMTEGVMTSFRNRQNDEDVPEDVHLTTHLLTLSAREQLDAICDTG
jgi:hypothetical protein